MKKSLVLFLLLFFLYTLADATRPPFLATQTGSKGHGNQLYVSHYENVLGTSMELKVTIGSQEASEKTERVVMSEITRLSKILSGYDPQSEFSQWFRTNGTAIRVSAELFEVLSLFDQWRIRTNGALDASAEVVTQVWKKAAAEKRLPTPGELTAAIEAVRHPHWYLDGKTRTAMHLDCVSLILNSFAKSYIIAHAIETAKKSTGAAGIVLNIGGDLVVSGQIPESIDVSDPRADTENDLPIDRIDVGNSAIATSGNYRRGVQILGHWYSHIVDPRTGQPADGVLSATVVAPSATDAGALATAFNVLSLAECIRLAGEFPGVEYLIVTKDGNRIESQGWNNLRDKRGVPARQSVYPDAQRGRENSVFNDFELVVNLEINMQKEGSVKRPYVAVWVEDEDHAPVRTITVWHGNDRYLPELKSWYLKYRGVYNTDRNFGPSVTSATRSAGKYAVKWDGKNDKGDAVKPGKYVIKIEVSREHGTYQLMRQELEWNDQPKTVTLTSNIEIASASLDYRKKPNGN